MTSSDLKAWRRTQLLMWAIGTILLLRLASLSFYPLMDTTEARYAEISRIMVETGDWVTPWYPNGMPFWGKPPLSFWVTALSFQLFGVNEMAARLPQLAIAIGVGWLVWSFARCHSEMRAAVHAVALLAGATLFLISSGAVMTDMTLTLGVTMVMVGFWQSVQARKADCRLLVAMAIGIAIGLLAKGPVSIVLWGVPIAGWMLLTGCGKQALQRVPWLGITLLALLITGPWYVWAEMRSPGFLRYFIVGEHWHRFVVPGWIGDLYGTAHQFPRGSIWVFAAIAAIPWPPLLAALWLVRSRAIPVVQPPECLARRSEHIYMALWALTPCLFFSLAGNVLWTYVLPGLPALAILGGYWTASHARAALTDGTLGLGLAISSVSMIGLLLFAQYDRESVDKRSTKALIQAYRLEAGSSDAGLYFLGSVPFSASFYSRGIARPLVDIGGISPGRSDYLVIDEHIYKTISSALEARATLITIRGGRALVRFK